MSTPPALRPGHGVSEALRAIASQTLNEASEAVADSGRDRAIAIHDFRKAMKRWRALLRLLGPFLGDGAQQWRQDARDLSRSLTNVRDARSALDGLEDLRKHGLLPSRALSETSVATIHRRLGELRAKSERSAWNSRSRQRVMDYITEASYQVAQWDLGSIAFADIAEQLTKTYRRARRAIPENWQTASATELHELRRRVVEHRYQMEMVEPAWPRLGRIWVEEAQRLRNRLGEYQDLTLLAQFAAPHHPLAPWRSRLVPIIARQQASHATAAARVARRLFAEPPKAFRARLEALWQAQSGD